ncbi:MAG: LysM peptidoglycan-binding domain-containing protein [Verrucomicrobiales bacterium]|jgi:nucleoid-associated protein YgaU|nr:LysM peptidoglycan-binding domain-containing protein [Verrucomicrobiales bacterium]
MKMLLMIAVVTVSGAVAGLAQDPGEAQDALAERQKILKAADQLDLLVQQNSQLTQQLAALQERLQKLETVSGELRTQLAQQQKDWATEREKLLKEVARLVAAGGKAGQSAGEVGATPELAPAAGLEPGFEYVVQAGQSLWAIADAYQKNGVKVTVEDLRKANNLGKNDLLQVGQKLFIPKK